MIKVCYTEMDGPNGVTSRLEAAGHAGYAPAGQDIVCAGASTLMQTLICLLAGEKGIQSDAWIEPDGPCLVLIAAPPQSALTEGALTFAKAGFALLAERYPDYLRFADLSRRGEAAMMNLQFFADGGGNGNSGAGDDGDAPTLSRAQARQAIASGTMETAKAAAKAEAPVPHRAAPQPPAKQEKPALSRAQRQQAIASGTMRPARGNALEQGEATRTKPTPQEDAARKNQDAKKNPLHLPPRGQQTVRSLHARWAMEEALLRRSQPEFSLHEELKNPKMRRLMQMPGMRMRDAYRLTHYDDTLRQTARAVERGVMERIRQRGARPAENGIRVGAAAVTGTDVAHMTLAQREALERQVLHGAKIRL